MTKQVKGFLKDYLLRLEVERNQAIDNNDQEFSEELYDRINEVQACLDRQP